MSHKLFAHISFLLSSTSILQWFGECLWGDLSLCSFIDFDKIVSKILQNALRFLWNLVKIALEMLPSVTSWGSPVDAPQRGLARSGTEIRMSRFLGSGVMLVCALAHACTNAYI